MYIFAIERGNEGLIEFGENGVGDFVALMLNRLDNLHLFGNPSVMREHLLQRFRAHHNIFGLFGKKVEETLFARQQALQKSRHLGNSP